MTPLVEKIATLILQEPSEAAIEAAINAPQAQTFRADIAVMLRAAYAIERRAIAKAIARAIEAALVTTKGHEAVLAALRVPREETHGPS